METPLISVILPVHNAKLHVSEAIRSILNQSFTNFELIIIEDGSVDNSLKIIKTFIDNRIIIIENITNQGFNLSRNKGHKIARGKYICEMDANAIALPQRLEKQYEFMEKNPTIGIAGSCIKYLDSDHTLFCESNYEMNKIKLLKDNCIFHSTIIIRRNFIKKYDIFYNEALNYASEYDFISRSSNNFQIVNTKDALVHCRWVPQPLSCSSIIKIKPERDSVIIKQLDNFGINPSDLEKQIHLQLVYGVSMTIEFKQQTLKWIQKLKDSNERYKYYNHIYLNDFLDTLLNQQIFFKNEEYIKYNIHIQDKKEKINLLDVTFIIPLRIDSDKCLKNINTLLQIIDKEFNTNIIVIEADKQQNYFPPEITNSIYYEYIFDLNPVFHVTHYRNKMLKMVQTPYAAVWDPDVITSPKSIYSAAEQLRHKKSLMVYPYDGRIFEANPIFHYMLQDVFLYKQIWDILPKISICYGSNNIGGAFLVDCKRYIEAGGENEYLYGWGEEDAERVDRLKKFNFPITREEGVMYYLNHPKNYNWQIASMESEKIYQRQLFRSKNKLRDIPIPKIIHQIWEGPNGEPPNELFLSYAKTWKENNPKWDYKFWNTCAINEFLNNYFPEFIPIYKGFKYNVQRWDAIRYLILFRLGGVYADFDSECLKSLDNLVDGKTCCIGLEPLEHIRMYCKPFVTTNAFLASTPGHPFFKQVIKEISNNSVVHNDKMNYVLETTGPYMLYRLYNNYKNKFDITLTSPELTSPLSNNDIEMIIKGKITHEIELKLENAYAVHYFEGSWFKK